MNKIKKIFRSSQISYVLLFFVMLMITLPKSINFRDDAFFGDFSNMTGQARLLYFLNYRYMTWTSRIFIEAALSLFARDFHLLWKILDSLVYVILAISIKKVFTSKENANNKYIDYGIVLFVVLFPQTLMYSAGWIATSLNYLWPVTFGIVALIPIRKYFDKEKISWIEYLIYIVAMVFAANQEQVCLILLTVYIIFSVYFIVKKEKCIFCLVMLFISILSIVNLFVCPGNSVRSAQSIWMCFIDYNMYNIIDKSITSIIQLMRYYMFYFCWLYIIFSAIICVSIYKKYEDILYRVISIIPLIMGVAFTIFSNIFRVISINFVETFSVIDKNEIYINFENFDTILTYIPLLITILTVGCIVISIYLLFKDDMKKLIIASLVLGAGICSKLVMGFLITMFESGDRTWFILLITTLILNILLLEKVDEKQKKQIVNMLAVIAIPIIINNICLVLSIK